MKLFLQHLYRKMTGGFEQCKAEHKFKSKYKLYCQLDKGHLGKHKTAHGKEF